KMKVPTFELPSDNSLTTTESGLQYVEVRPGAGGKPSAKSEVEVHYAGWTTSGELFDASYKRGSTTSFPLSAVIPGWTEGLQLMNVGSAYTFVIPAHLAYGANGSPPVIAPNATLVFHVELISIG
ncbi:MAG: FKBP-type peptidyl-prolyl cis-trans isomerase, partial [Planctomycetota bacterium]|nr:FKBP-type peptidyl-prolyl cis-trans isomerase [Planctomycetota bacterium]